VIQLQKTTALPLAVKDKTNKLEKNLKNFKVFHAAVASQKMLEDKVVVEQMAPRHSA
jgi:hypothetical protein